jgi:polar amino acid transport system substrate-binding protein
VDVIIGTDCQADYEIKKLGLHHTFEKTQFKPQNSVELYLAISKKSPFAKDLNRINKVIQRLVNDGKIKKYAKKYYE